MSAEGDKEMDRRDGPVYRYIARGARRLGRTLQSGGYDAVVCVHVIPAMMMTALKQAWSACPVFCFVATDYTCSPTVGACTPGYLRHSPSGAGRRVRQLRHRPRYPPARRHSRAFRLPPAR